MPNTEDGHSAESRDLWELKTEHRVLKGQVEALEGRMAEREDSSEGIRKQVTDIQVDVATKFARLEVRLDQVSRDAQSASTKAGWVLLTVGGAFLAAVVVAVVSYLSKH